MRFRKFQALSGDSSNVMDYAAYIPPARAYVGLRQARYALEELCRAKTFHDFFARFIEVQHHLNIALGSLDATADHQGSPGAYDRLRGYILDKYDSAVRTIPKDIVDAGEYWCRL